MKRRSEGVGVRLTGDYAMSGSPPQPVVLTRLASGHCLASQCGKPPPTGTEVEIWIGAVGPLKAQVDQSGPHSVSFVFRVPLDPVLLDQFETLRRH